MRKFLDDSTRKKIEDAAKTRKTKVQSVGYHGGVSPYWEIEFADKHKERYPYKGAP